MSHPAGWRAARLSDICEVRSGSAFPKRLQGRDEGDLPFAKVRDISRAWSAGQRVLTGAANYVSQEDAVELRARPMPAGTTVLAKIGEAVRLDRRVVLGQPTLMDNNVMGWIPDRSVVTPEFLYWLSRTISLADLTRAVAVPAVRKTEVEALTVFIPSLEEQDAVVARVETLLDKVDDGSEGLARALRETARYRAAVLAVHYEGPARVVSLDDLAHVQSGIAKGRPKAEQTQPMPYIRTANVQAGYLDLEVIKTLPVTPQQRDKHLLRPNDVLILEGGDADKVGRGWIWEGQVDGCLHQNHVFSVRPDSTRLLPRFLAHFVNAPQARKYFLSVARQTVNLASINKGNLKALPVPIPTLDEQHRVVETLDRQLASVDAMAAGLRSQLDRAIQLRRAVLASAMRGDLLRQPGTGNAETNNSHAVPVAS